MPPLILFVCEACVRFCASQRHLFTFATRHNHVGNTTTTANESGQVVSVLILRELASYPQGTRMKTRKKLRIEQLETRHLMSGIPLLDAISTTDTQTSAVSAQPLAAAVSVTEAPAFSDLGVDTQNSLFDFDAGAHGFTLSGSGASKVTLGFSNSVPSAIGTGRSLVATVVSHSATNTTNLIGDVPANPNLDELSFWIKVSNPNAKLNVLVTDFNGQTLSFPVKLRTSTGWQKVFVEDLNGAASWSGGPNNGIHYGYIRKFTLQLNGAFNGTIGLDNVEYKEPRLGVNSRLNNVGSFASIDKEIALLKAGGFDWVRIMLPWTSVQPNSRTAVNNSFLNRFDYIVNKLASEKIRVLPILAWTPKWASGTSDRNAAPQNMNDWQNFVQLMANRYGQKIRYWSIWNEPNVHHDGYAFRGSVGQMVQMAQIANNVLKAKNPEMRSAVAFAGKQDDLTWNWTDQFFRQGGANAVDYIDYHSYADTRGYVNRQERMAEIIQRYHLENKPIWISEGGATDEGDPQLETWKNTQLAAMQEYLFDVVHVEKTFLFELYKQPVGDITSVIANMGLFNRDGKETSALFAAANPFAASSDFALQADLGSAAVPYLAVYEQSLAGERYANWNNNSFDGVDLTVAPGKSAGFKISDEWIDGNNGGLDKNVVVDIEYLDFPAGPIKVLHRDENMIWKSAFIQRTGTMEYRQASVTFENIMFDGRSSFSGSDFQIRNAGATAPLNIHQIVVRKESSRGVAVLGDPIDPKGYIHGKRLGVKCDDSSTTSALACSKPGNFFGERSRAIAANKNFSVDIHDTYANSTAYELTFRYFDNSNNDLLLYYKNTAGTLVSVPLPRGNTNQWIERRLVINNLRADNDVWGQDLRVSNAGTSNATAFFSKIEVAAI